MTPNLSSRLDRLSLEDRVKNLEALVTFVVLAAGSIILASYFSNMWIKLTFVATYAFFGGMALPQVLVASYFSTKETSMWITQRILQIVNWGTEAFQKNRKIFRIISGCLLLVPLFWFGFTVSQIIALVLVELALTLIFTSD